ncbi:amidohydrolase family protein [Clostridium cadaveris]|uniref:amidohydrolase family protein n=1 Tax=Clostridium cadaveris TaxID=1529 RepID=UPI00041877B2|nr:amidohydrolase family protein [Clostridium cadaveris]NWK09784.1 amidohydrolase family protein [Clostridium cadaveris]UFH64535.1 amidohydrolase [Clostridium cadaveris]
MGKIIDAHLHLPVDEELHSFEDKKQRLIKELNKNGILGAVVIADSVEPSDIGTNDQCIRLFKDKKYIHIIAGISVFYKYEDNLEKLEKYLKNKDIVAIKIYPGHERFYINDSRLIKVYNLCTKYDVPIAIHTDRSVYATPYLMSKLALTYPKLKIVYCHIGFPNIYESYIFTMDKDNIYYDISSVAYYDDTIENSKGIISQIVREKEDRVIFGSDYGGCSMKAHKDFVESLDITYMQREKLFHINAEKLYKLET